MTARVLVAGIGNIFLGDDGFGVEVASRLADRELPPGVTAADFGIRGMHMAYDMLENGYDTTVFVDAVSRGDRPGTLYEIEADVAACLDADVDAHGMTPDAVLALLHRLGGVPGRVFVLGCEPRCTDEGIGLSAPVAAAVDAAVTRVCELAGELARQAGGTTTAEERRECV